MSNITSENNNNNNNNTVTTMETIIKPLLKNCEEWLIICHTVHPNDKSWTIADLFIRQFLNNCCDGFGMRNVEKMYYFLLKHKSDLIKYNLISKNGYNNSGYPLWSDYNFETKMSAATIKKIQKEMAEVNNALQIYSFTTI